MKMMPEKAKIPPRSTKILPKCGNLMRMMPDKIKIKTGARCASMGAHLAPTFEQMHVHGRAYGCRLKRMCVHGRASAQNGSPMRVHGRTRA